MLQQAALHNNRTITRTVWLLSVVSLLMDTAGEMLYPVMPVFLRHVGFSFLLIGILEGVAEAVAGLSKPYFGHRSDLLGRRLPFVQLGYTLSAISKPLLAVMAYPLWIFFARTVDRIGKGIRTGARDALLSDESTPATRGRIFGFHRSMDTVGAILGPAVALVFLYYYPQQYNILFIIAFAPGLLAIGAILLIKEKPRPPIANAAKPGLFSFLHYWKKSPATYKRLATGLLLFALFNSSDAFLLLKMKEAGLTDTAVIAVYIFYNMVFALLAYPAGILADRLGMKTVLLTGLVIYAAVYAGFAFGAQLPVFIALFAGYGFYAAATDGIAKAWISNMVPSGETATAIGTFSGLQSLAAMVASSLTGGLWLWLGSTPTLLITAGIALVAVLYLSQIKLVRYNKVQITTP